MWASAPPANRTKRDRIRLPLSLSSAPPINMTAPALPTGRTTRESFDGMSLSLDLASSRTVRAWIGEGYHRSTATCAPSRAVVGPLPRLALPWDGRKRCMTKGILERLAEGPVLGDGGYLLELEKRGYVQAGPFTPEVVIEHPDALAQLH